MTMPKEYGIIFCLTLLTNSSELAAQADRAGVDRIGVDLERLGKEGRQGQLNTWISDHSLADLSVLARHVRPGRLFCRVNPIHPGSADEIDAVLDLGANTVMLPMFTTTKEADTFIRLVDGRAQPVLLLETAAAAGIAGDICRVPGVTEIHIGMNDLRLSLGWPSHFDVLVSDLLVGLSEAINSAGIAFRLGGLGRAGDASLPIPSDLVYPQYPRLHGTGALISRAFFNIQSLDMVEEIRALRERLDFYHAQSSEDLEACRHALREKVEALRRAQA